MVALTGQWWVDVRKPKKTDVAAHLVNLAWNGLRDLEAKPRLLRAMADGRLPMHGPDVAPSAPGTARTSVQAMSDQTPPDPYAVPPPASVPPPPPPQATPGAPPPAGPSAAGRVPPATSRRVPGTDLSRGRVPRRPARSPAPAGSSITALVVAIIAVC